MPDMIQRKASNVLAGDTIMWIDGPLKVKKKTIGYTRHVVTLSFERGFKRELDPNDTVGCLDEGHTKSHHLGEFPYICSECGHELRHEYEYETAPEPLED